MFSNYWTVLTCLLVLLGSLGEAKPYHHPDMDKVDVCIFTCDYCFKNIKGDFLVGCANECVAMEGVMGPLWSRTCPFFDKPSQSDSNYHPF